MKTKHFLDTSVLRPLLISTPKVKQYYQSILLGECYVCEYTKMEFFRGYIKSAINFYFLLSMPQYSDFSDVLNIWSHKFQIREHKNIEIMVANLLKTNNCLNDKAKSLRILADYIRRLIGKIDCYFTKLGNDNTYCPKGKQKLRFDPSNPDQSFRLFLAILADNKQYEMCKINEFVKNKHKSDVRKITNHAMSVKREKQSEGFHKLVDNLHVPKEKEITCAHCAKIGDAIIAMLSDNNWTLEHTDYSFNYLCEILKKNHRIHPIDNDIMS